MINTRNEGDHVPDTLLSSVLARAESDAHFLASAMAAWRQAHPDIEAHDLLRCRKDDLWRIALAPRPKDNAEFSTTVKRIADAFAIDLDGLISLLRLADALNALAPAGSGADELLMAARDRSPKDKDQREESELKDSNDESDQR